MADLDKVLKGLSQCMMADNMEGYETQCRDCSYFNPEVTVQECIQPLKNDAIALLKSQQAEIERLEQENATLKIAIQSMPNWLDDKRPEVVRCKDCRFHDYAAERASVTYWMPCDEYKTDGNWFCGWGKRKDGEKDGTDDQRNDS